MAMNIEANLSQRILILDGAMGTKIQSLELTAEDYHCGRFKDWHIALTGNNDVLCLTAPNDIPHIHEQYIEAGADIISTNAISKLKNLFNLFFFILSLLVFTGYPFCPGHSVFSFM